MLSAAILDGGRARRFGGLDKGALRVGGHSIRERQLAELATISSEILVVGSKADPAVPESRGPVSTTVNAHASRPGTSVRFVADRVPDCGPLGGLYTALLESTGTATIVVACDMPFISARLLAHLAALLEDADVVVPRTERGYHPLCAVYTRDCLEPLERRIARRQLKMTELFADVRVHIVTARELAIYGDVDRLLANLNSPADLRDLDALQPERP